MNQKDVRQLLAHNMDNILNTIHENLLITDGQGKVLVVSTTFEKSYGIKKEKALQMTVFEMEEEGYFSPSIIAVALKEKKKITMQQKNNKNRDILVTATPILDEKEEIKFVVSYSRDITEMIRIQKNFTTLKNRVVKCEREIKELRKEKAKNNEIICESEELKKIITTIQRIAEFNATVLITGPSGVGKTMFAKEIHNLSLRRKKAFVDINCATIPETLLESELFGYEKGAFTGANEKGKIGLFELADGGTLFLDEITELTVALQAKILKAIQEKKITRIGGTKSIDIDFRLVAATNQDIESLVEKKEFRSDLYYRLSVVNIHIPPLIERKKDIIPLCKHFLEKFNKMYGMKKEFDQKALQALLKYDWPGNVRELSNAIESSAIISENESIGYELLPNKNVAPHKADKYRYDIQEIVGWQEDDEPNIGLQEVIEKVEGSLIRKAYERYKTSSGVGKALGISQPTAHRKISKYVD